MTGAEQTKAAFDAWWPGPTAILPPEPAKDIDPNAARTVARLAYLAGHASRDAEVAALQQKPITVSESLPAIDPSITRRRVSVDVVCWNGSRWACGWFCFDDGQWSTDSSDDDVTHWLQLPSIPASDHQEPVSITEVLDCGCTVNIGWRCPVHGQP